MTAQIYAFPVPEDFQPREYEDAAFWEAVADTYAGQMSPARARRLIDDAPDPHHPLVSILKTML